MTATATPDVRAIIVKDLTMRDCVRIISDPNKPNIRYAVIETDPSDLYGTFGHIIDDIRKNNIKASKVLIFCRKKEHVKDLYELFSEHLGTQAYYRPSDQEPVDDRSRIFAMYHKKTHKLVKSTIEREFCEEDGIVRVVFCTIAFGMGVNVKGAHLVIHVGPSGDLDDYLQESGRIGRTGNQLNHAILLRYKGCTRSKNITKQMKNYVTNISECRRTLLLRPFSCTTEASSTSSIAKHCCCDVCAESCRCVCICGTSVDCKCNNFCPKQQYQSIAEIAIRTVHAEKNSVNTTTKKIVNVVTDEQLTCLQDHLMAYRSELAQNCCHEKLLTGLDYATGYSSMLVNDILKNIKYIESLQSLKSKFFFYNDEHAVKTWEIICDVLSLVTEQVTSSNETSSIAVAGNNGDASESASDCDSEDSNISIAERTVRLHIISSSEGEETCSD